MLAFQDVLSRNKWGVERRGVQGAENGTEREKSREKSRLWRSCGIGKREIGGANDACIQLCVDGGERNRYLKGGRNIGHNENANEYDTGNFYRGHIFLLKNSERLVRISKFGPRREQNTRGSRNPQDKSTVCRGTKSAYYLDMNRTKVHTLDNDTTAIFSVFFHVIGQLAN